MEKAITKKQAAKKMADLKKGKGSASGAKKKKTTRRKQASGSLTSSQPRKSTAVVVGKFVKLFAYKLPKEKKPTKGKKTGRPPVITEPVLRKLEQAFAIDCTVEEACILAGIGTRTYYDFLDKHPDFSQTIELLRNIPFLLARQTIIDGIMNNYSQAMDYMSRKKKGEFSHKLEMSHDGGIKHTHDIDPEAKAAVDGIFALFEKKAREVAPSVVVSDDE